MRKTGRIILLVVFFLLLAIGLIIFLFNAFTASSSSQEAFFEEEIRDIYISAENADMVIRPSENESTAIELSGNNKDFSLSTDLDRNQLTVNISSTSRFFDFSSSDAPLLTVHIPLTNFRTLRLYNGNGNIQISDIELYESTAYTANGDIELQNVYTKYFKAETANGGIRAKESEGQIVETDSSNGDIHLENITAYVNLIANSSNGKIELQTVELASPIEFTTNNGDIIIQTENKPTQGRIQAHALNGKVNIFGDDSGQIAFEGDFPFLKVDAVNGNIVME